MSAALKMDPMDPSLDLAALTRDLDRTKSAVFMNPKRSCFFGPLMCSLAFHWDESVGTAATDGVSLWWAPSYFLKLPKLSRETDLMHELWHVASLHMIRRGTRDPKIFNIACDIKIDLMLEAEGYSFEGIKGVLTWPQLDARKYVGWVEEDIYDDLVKNAVQPPPNYVPDIQPTDSKQNTAQSLNNVVRAIHQAKLGGGAGHIPGDIETLLEKFLAPVVPWEQYLHHWFHDLIENSYSWKRPNRRYMASGYYLPSLSEDEGRLAHLMYFEDVSGSISDADALRFNSEVKYVKETFEPEQMTLVQFDTRITQEIVLKKDDPFEQIKIIGRGGTCLRCVREHIIQHKPTAVVIFSDLDCAPMEKLPFEIPVLWVCIRNRGKTVPFGKLIHIQS